MKVDKVCNEIDLFLIRPAREAAKPRKKVREKKRGRKSK
jgi:hypothetical protein